MTEQLVVHRDQREDVAIVFVHGFGGNPRKTWGSFPQFLVDDGRLATWDVFSRGYPTSLWFDHVGIWRANPDLGAVAGLLRTNAAVPVRRYPRATRTRPSPLRSICAPRQRGTSFQAMSRPRPWRWAR